MVIAWVTLQQILFERIDRHPMRARYEALDQ
jgi:hypothetical protein